MCLCVCMLLYILLGAENGRQSCNKISGLTVFVCWMERGEIYSQKKVLFEVMPADADVS